MQGNAASREIGGVPPQKSSSPRSLMRRRPERMMKLLFAVAFIAVASNVFYLDLEGLYSTSVLVVRNETFTTGFANEVEGKEAEAASNRSVEIPKDTSTVYKQNHNETADGTLIRQSSLDPLSLKKSISKFFQSEGNGNSKSETMEDGGDYDERLWNLLENYPSDFATETQHQNLTLYYEDDLSSDLICGAGPGRGMEQDGGYKLLLEKVRVADPPGAANDSTAKPKVLCMVYTYSALRHLSRAQALLWGQHCDGFLAFSNETIPELGIYQLPDHPEESYWIMWQKTRKILKQAHDHFLNDFDYFYLSGNDVFLIVENLRAYIQEMEAVYPPKPRHFGAWLPDREFVSGGPGYVLNRAALEKYFQVLPGKPDNSSAYNSCQPNLRKPHEDRLLSKCLSSTLGIWGNDTDTRDFDSGSQRFHNVDPVTLYTFRATTKSRAYFDRKAKFWEDQPMPRMAAPNSRENTNETMVVGPKHGLDAASKYSISLHKIHTPTYLARIHAILHRSCPTDSPLGRGLQLHGLPHVAE